jgi:hypothetical protein
VSVLFCARLDHDLTFAEHSEETWFNLVYNWSGGNPQTHVDAYLGFNGKVFNTDKAECCRSEQPSHGSLGSFHPY